MMFQKPKGTTDLLPDIIQRWQRIEHVVHSLCERYVYREIRTPIFEATELYRRGVGQTTDVVEKEMYSFLDKANRNMTLRPEGTAGVVRAFIEHKMYAEQDVTRLYYMGPMFRYEQPQSGRYRQFHQFGIEAFGTEDPTLDVETIALGQQLCDELGLSDVFLEINSVGTPAEREVYGAQLRAFLAPLRTQLCADCQSRMERNPLRVLDCKVDQHLFGDAPVLLDELTPKSRAHFEQVQAQLDALGIAYTVNPRLVRGLDYYTHTAFEWKVRAQAIGSINTIGGGGRYNGLVSQLGGPLTPAVGLAFGLERLVLLMTQQGGSPPQPPTAYFVTWGDEAMRCVQPWMYALRQAGVVVTADAKQRQMKTQLKQAVRTEATFAVLLGETELAQRRVILKRLATGEQQEVGFDDLVAVLTKAHHERHAHTAHHAFHEGDAPEK